MHVTLYPQALTQKIETKNVGIKYRYTLALVVNFLMSCTSLV